MSFYSTTAKGIEAYQHLERSFNNIATKTYIIPSCNYKIHYYEKVIFLWLFVFTPGL